MKRPSPHRSVLVRRQQYVKHRPAKSVAKFYFWIGTLLVLLPALLYILTLVVYTDDPNRIQLQQRFMAPSSAHLFGTDNYGRDVFLRAMYGFPTTLMIAGGTALIGLCGGLLLGGLAGFLGGWVDYWISRLNDAFLAMPAILMGMLFYAVFGNGVLPLIIALGLMFMPSFARVVRSGIQEHRNRDYVKRLMLLGASTRRILGIHLLPQIQPRLWSALAIGFANAILAESSLSFLGLGVSPPQMSWGRMLKDAQGFMFQAPWYALFPGLLIVCLVLGTFCIGKGFKAFGEVGQRA